MTKEGASYIFRTEKKPLMPRKLPKLQDPKIFEYMSGVSQSLKIVQFRSKTTPRAETKESASNHVSGSHTWSTPGLTVTRRWGCEALFFIEVLCELQWTKQQHYLQSAGRHTRSFIYR